jgi:pimeloyl-ACP methyl ester carboxylesterase
MGVARASENPASWVIGDAQLTVALWGTGPPEVVFLHDGLGSIAQWRDVPARVADVLGCSVAAIDRPGHGASTPIPSGPWPTDWLHREADRLARLRSRLAPEPLLVGHSDGGSIALLHAAATDAPLRGVVALAAHSWVEQRCIDAISAMTDDRDRVVAALGRAHQHPDRLFDAWSGVWLSDGFRPWDIRPDLGTITCPVTVVQGSADEYATEAHLHRTAEAIGPNAVAVLVDGSGHLLHHQSPDEVVDIVRRSYLGEDPAHA